MDKDKRYDTSESFDDAWRRGVIGPVVGEDDDDEEWGEEEEEEEEDGGDGSSGSQDWDWDSDSDYDDEVSEEGGAESSGEGDSGESSSDASSDDAGKNETSGDNTSDGDSGSSDQSGSGNSEHGSDSQESSTGESEPTVDNSGGMPNNEGVDFSGESSAGESGGATGDAGADGRRAAAQDTLQNAENSAAGDGAGMAGNAGAAAEGAGAAGEGAAAGAEAGAAAGAGGAAAGGAAAEAGGAAAAEAGGAAAGEAAAGAAAAPLALVGTGANTVNMMTGGKQSDSGANVNANAGNNNENNDDKDSSGDGGGDKKGSGSGGGIRQAASLLVIAILFFALAGVFLLALPILAIGTIDYGLQQSLGISETVALLEEQGEHVIDELLAEGKLDEQLAQDLAEQGIEVGQVTANGEFVQTSTYIAGLGEEVAANGEYHVAEESGSLAVRFKDRIIEAGGFVMAVESDPEMYAAYSAAADMAGKYYYSNEVSTIFKDLGISRGNFNSWQLTGDDDADQKSFNEILAKMLEVKSNFLVGGYDAGQHWQSGWCGSGDDAWWTPYKNWIDESFEYYGTVDGIVKEWKYGYCQTNPTPQTGTSSGSGMAESLTQDVAGSTKYSGDSSKATKKAAELLNTAISSSEPYKAAQAFVALEEPIQRARTSGDGPVNEVMNVISEKVEVSYTDIESGSEVTTYGAIIDSPNFSAAVSQGEYSLTDALNFSRDRAIIVTNTKDASVTKNATLGEEPTTRKSKMGSIVEILAGNTADYGTLSKIIKSLDLGVMQDGSELFSSVIGGNRIVSGGSFLANTINQRALGAMPSDTTTIMAYHEKAEEALARKSAAERATRSPFDISSPDTFLGNIVYKMSASMLGSGGLQTGKVLSTATGAVADVAGEAVASLTTGASADGSDVFTTMSGNCSTVTAIGVEGDLYCNSHNTVSTKYMNYSLSDWQSALDGELTEDGAIIQKRGNKLAEFVLVGADREVTVGVRSADVCEKYKDLNATIWTKISTLIATWLGVYGSCSSNTSSGWLAGLLSRLFNTTVDEKVATGEKYAFKVGNSTDEYNPELYGGYLLYDAVRGMLSNTVSNVSVFREEYYKEHLKDDSAAGVLARRSGMTVAEAEMALAYADYVTWIANYDASGLYAFGTAPSGLLIGDPLERGMELIEQQNDLTTTVGILGKMREMDDLRRKSLSFVL